MRIISGTLGSRRIAVPAGIRPTQDRVREAIFSALGTGIAGSRVLDLFAGSGSIGLEAWSRGAERVCWVEQNAQVFRVLRQNVQTLCGAGTQGAECVRNDVWTFLSRAHTGPPYDFILADPPYDRHTIPFDQYRFLTVLWEKGWASTDTLLVFEQRAASPAAEHRAWLLIKDKKYSDTRVRMYRCVESAKQEF